MSEPLLERLGLHRPELRAWAMYDWANSAFYLIIITAVFPIFFRGVAAAELDGTAATFRFAIFTTIALTTVAVMAPILGALADYLAWRKRLMAVFVGLGVVATASMFFIQRGDWLLAGVLFALGNVGVTTSLVFYDSLLPHIARPHEIDRVSTAGYAVGYLGGVLLLILNLVWIEQYELFGFADKAVATRFGFLSVGVWWALFSLPLFRRVSEPPPQVGSDKTDPKSVLRVAFRRLRKTFHELRSNYRHAFQMLLAMLIYNDGIGTVIRMAGLYAVARDIPQQDVLVAIVLAQFVGIPFAFLFGALAGKIGAKRSILLALLVFTGVVVVAYNMKTATEFYLLAFMIGAVQGGAQALSRSLFVSMIPKHKAAEFFGFFSVFEKFAGIFGPAIFGAFIALTGSMREAILSVVFFFALGAAILATVDITAGQRQAREAEERHLADS